MGDEEDEESCLTRQLNEKDVLKAIYCDQLVFLSEEEEPLECILQLWGDVPVSGSPATVPQLDLHIICSEQYPLSSPAIRVENWKKIPNDEIKLLEEALFVIADTRKGEVMIHELAQHCENFLCNIDCTDFGSLYEGMMQRNRDLEESKAKELQKKKEDEERKRAEILSHIQHQQQAVKKALRRKSKSETVDDAGDEWGQSERRVVCDKHAVLQESAANSKKPIGDNDTFTPWDLLTHGHGLSRFENDFELIKKLGVGAYGEVVKVRNRLDGGFYAIKRIELNPSMRQLNRITREVKLLSCLNHENVVRYYNSWVEIANADKSETDTSTEEQPANFQSIEQDVLNMLPCGHDITLRWDEPKEENDDSESDWLVFGNGSNHSLQIEATPSPTEKSNLTPKPLLYMYIQMELCEKNTLRIAIDKGLYKDSNRVWRLFREIVEGLCHIHGQGIMHRDLKPVNIFLGNNDQVKIGDFGLATSSKTAKHTPVNRDTYDSVELPEESNLAGSSSKKDTVSHTGPVGTALYVAPELDKKMPQTYYNQKVDIYSLGIIFFEMNHPVFSTAMERHKTLNNLRTADIIFPTKMHYDKCSNEYKLINRMLCHDINDRPTCQELLAHECLSIVKLDEGEVKDMVTRTLSNPQSKDYKFLIASCLNQKMSAAFEATYNMSTFKSFWYLSSMSVVEERLRSIFHKFGAVAFSPPLFTPGQAPTNGVSLMTNVGGVVHATVDLQMSFARYVVLNPSITNFKRYAIDKTYREMPVGIHPREVYECSFDIVSSSSGELMPDIEVFAIVHELFKLFPHLIRKNGVIYLNHSILITSLIQVCLTSSSVNVVDTDLRDSLVKVLIESTSPGALLQNLRTLNLSETAINMIFQWQDIECSPKEADSKMDLFFKDPDIAAQCKRALKQLNLLVKKCEQFEMTCPILIKPSLFRNPNHYTNIIFEITCDLRMQPKAPERCVILSGGRYDGLLEELKQKILTKDVSKHVKCVTGFTMNLENLVSSIDDDGKPALVDVLFCTLGCPSMKPEHFNLLKDLWAMNLKVYFSNTLQTLEEIQHLCNQLGAPTLLLAKGNDPGFVRVRTFTKENKPNERKLSFNEAVDYFVKPFKQDSVTMSRNVVNLPIITFIEMVNVGNMKIYESQILENLSGVVQRLSNNVRIEVLALTVKGEFIRFIGSWLGLDNPMTSLEPVLKRFPNMKKLILKISKHIEDVLNTHPTSVIIFYSLIDNTYKVVM